LKNIIISELVIFVAAKKVEQQIFFPLLFLLLNPGSEIRDPGWIKIRIWDFAVDALLYFHCAAKTGQPRITPC
jgi:hypothetical protein